MQVTIELFKIVQNNHITKNFLEQDLDLNISILQIFVSPDVWYDVICLIIISYVNIFYTKKNMALKYYYIMILLYLCNKNCESLNSIVCQRNDILKSNNNKTNFVTVTCSCDINQFIDYIIFQSPFLNSLPSYTNKFFKSVTEHDQELDRLAQRFPLWWKWRWQWSRRWHLWW